MIKKIKKFSFKDLVGREGEVCSICLDDYKETDQVVQLKCSKYHIFHYDCIKEMINSNDSSIRKCPFCRKDLEI